MSQRKFLVGTTYCVNFSNDLMQRLVKQFPLDSPQGKDIYRVSNREIYTCDNIEIHIYGSYYILEAGIIIDKKTNTIYEINDNIGENKEVINFLEHMKDDDIFTPYFYKKILSLAFGIKKFNINMDDVLTQYNFTTEQGQKIFPLVDLGDIYNRDNYDYVWRAHNISIEGIQYTQIIDIKTNKIYLVNLMQQSDTFYGYYYPSPEDFVKEHETISFEYIDTRPYLNEKGWTIKNSEIIGIFNYSSEIQDSKTILYKKHIFYGIMSVFDDYTFKIEFDSDHSKERFYNTTNIVITSESIYGSFKYNNILDSPLYWRNNDDIYKSIIQHIYLENEKFKIISIDIDLPYKYELFELLILYPRIIIEENMKLIIKGEKKLEECCKFTQEYIAGSLTLSQLESKYNMTGKKYFI